MFQLVTWVLSERKLLADKLPETVSRISDATRSRTVNYYESVWRKWDNWRGQQGFDHIGCDLNPILDYF